MPLHTSHIDGSAPQNAALAERLGLADGGRPGSDPEVAASIGMHTLELAQSNGSAAPDATGSQLHDSAPADETDPALLAAIDQEITEGIAAEGSAFGFYNNLWLKMPGGETRNQMEEYDINPLHEPSSPHSELHSDLYLGHYENDLYKDIDMAVKATGMDTDDTYLRLLEECNNGGSAEGQAAAREALSQHLEPVYRQLRLQGYSPYDLTC